MTVVRTTVGALTSVPRLPRMPALVVTAVLVSACGIKLPFARVEGVVVRDQYDESPQASQVRVIRANAVVSPSVSMRLQPGDSITTSADTRVVIELGVGYRVTLDTSTSIFLETGATGSGDVRPPEPSERGEAAYLNRLAGARVIGRGAGSRLRRTSADAASADALAQSLTSLFLKIGKAFIERLRGAPDSLTIGTPGSKLHIVGTRFLIAVNSSARTAVTVAAGAVRAVSTDSTDRWSPITYSALQHGEYGGGARPGPVRTVQPQTLETELRWVRTVERLTRIPVPRLDSLTEAEARAAVERVGLRIFLVRHEKTGRAAPERVVDQTPSAGDSLPPGGYVSLVLESTPRRAPADSAAGGRVPGANVQMCTVPKIVDLSRDAAERLLKADGFTGQGTRDAGEIDRVTSQGEVAGTRRPCGSVVRYRYGLVG